MANFLITGGAGFIASNYLLMMVDRHKEDRFVCLDVLTYAGNKGYLEPIMDRSNFRFVHGDIRDEALVDSLFQEERFDYVINFAAETHVDNSIKDPKLFFETNVIGTNVLLNAAVKYGVKRFHQVSTDEVYGGVDIGYPLKFDENSPLNPSSPYSSSKAAADLMVMSYKRTYGLAVSISRSSNNYGKNQHPEKLIPLIVKKAMNNEEIPIYGSGENVRDWLNVEDNVEAIDLIVRHGKDGEIYNIASHNERSNLQIVTMLLGALHKPYSLMKFVADRPGHDVKYQMDTSKIEKLGWKARHSIEDDLGSLAAALKEQFVLSQKR